MMQAEQKDNQTKDRWAHALNIGFFAGLFFGVLKIVEYFLKFTRVIPGFLVEPFMKHSFLITWQGNLFGLTAFIVFSMITALLYTAFFVKVKGPWMGIGYGLLWWVILYVMIGPLLKMMPAIIKIDLNSLVTDFCLFLLWGGFIGYSITFEFTDERSSEPIVDEG